MMMSPPSHNSVIEAEACVAAGFRAWHHWDTSIAFTLWGLPSQPWAFRGHNLHEELLTDAGKCPLSEQLWSFISLKGAQPSESTDTSTAEGPPGNHNHCHYINTLQLTQLGGDRVKVWKGRRRGKARKDKRGSAPPQLAKSVLWFRQVQFTAALVILLGRERSWGKRLLELNIFAHSSLWEFNGCEGSVLCMHNKVFHVCTWTFREPNSET